MTNDILIDILKFASPSAVLIIFFWKIVMPWSNWFLAKKSNNGLKERVDKFENHTYTEICRRFDKLEERIDRIEKVNFDQGERLSHLEGFLNRRKTFDN